MESNGSENVRKLKSRKEKKENFCDAEHKLWQGSEKGTMEKKVF